MLVCTTIIGSGIDIPNANTIIVDRADHFGLSQLYQIRGRVGRQAPRLRLPWCPATAPSPRRPARPALEDSPPSGRANASPCATSKSAAPATSSADQAGHIAEWATRPTASSSRRSGRARGLPPAPSTPPWTPIRGLHPTGQQKMTMYRRLAGVARRGAQRAARRAARPLRPAARARGPAAQAMGPRARAGRGGVRRIGRTEAFVAFEGAAMLPRPARQAPPPRPGQAPPRPPRQARRRSPCPPPPTPPRMPRLPQILARERVAGGRQR